MTYASLLPLYRKMVIALVTVLLFVGCERSSVTQISEDQLIKGTLENTIPTPDEVLILNALGDQISSDSLMVLLSSGRYFQDFYVNKEDEIVQVIVRDKRKEDDELVDRIKKKMNETTVFKSVEINCLDKAEILQNVFDRDQEMRTGNNKIDPKIDHENLEIIISLLEACGMPTLQEVNDVQMAGIWGVLQHAPPKYQSKYIPLLEKSAKNGDVKWSVIALMQDRALMYEGKPQIYGSQFKNGELYNLYEPEFVNQRRSEIDMQPLEDYLQRFGIQFNVEQKTK